jgi:hypothetical protein
MPGLRLLIALVACSAFLALAEAIADPGQARRLRRKVSAPAMRKLRCRLSMLVEDLLRRRATAKAAAGLRKLLREYGFTESEPGRWEGTLTPTINSIEITLPTKKQPRSPAFYALIIVIANLVAVGAVAFGLAWLVAAVTELAKSFLLPFVEVKVSFNVEWTSPRGPLVPLEGRHGVGRRLRSAEFRERIQCPSS